VTDAVDDAVRRAWVDLGLAIADETDEIGRRHFRRDVRVSAKADRTLVTEADEAIERVARERIRAAYPSHGLVGEEYGEQAADAAIRWYIDPIDGTANFVRGVPVFAMLLAVEREGRLEAAVISAPALRERWYAWRGGGAWAVGRAAIGGDETPRALHVSSVAAIPHAHVLYGSGRDIVATGLMPGFDPLLSEAWRERGFGDFWGYALLADGAAEAMIEVGLSSWDAAAPALLVEEAGGRWSDLEGRQRLDSGTFIATNGILHDEVLERLRGAQGQSAPTPDPAA
jgi:histidinol-phosphatase